MKMMMLSMATEQNTCSKPYHHGWNKRLENKDNHQGAHMNNGVLEEFWKKLASSSQLKQLVLKKNTRVKRGKKRNPSPTTRRTTGTHTKTKTNNISVLNSRNCRK